MDLSSRQDPPSIRMPSGLSWKRFTHLNPEEAARVLQWRNAPSVRRWMVRTDPISEAEHDAFLDRLKRGNDPDYYLLSHEHIPFGVADFYRFDPERSSCCYGYYLDPSRLGSAMGLLLEYWVAEIALVQRGLQQLIAETRIDNMAARELHAHFGFSVRGTNGRQLEEAVLDAPTWMQRRDALLPWIERFAGEI